MIGLKLPLLYSPQPNIYSGYSVALSSILENKTLLLAYKEEMNKVLLVLLDTLTEIDFRLQSDQVETNGVTH
jgi:hypothetical protein